MHLSVNPPLVQSGTTCVSHEEMSCFKAVRNTGWTRKCMLVQTLLPVDVHYTNMIKYGLTVSSEPVLRKKRKNMESAFDQQTLTVSIERHTDSKIQDIRSQKTAPEWLLQVQKDWLGPPNQIGQAASFLVVQGGRVALRVDIPEQGRYERSKGHFYKRRDRTLRTGLLASTNRSDRTLRTEHDVREDGSADSRHKRSVRDHW